MKQRRRRKLTKAMHTITFDDPTGVFLNLTPTERTAYMTRLIRKYIRKSKK